MTTKTFRKGGSTNPSVQGINKQKTHHGSIQLPNASLNKYVGHKSGGIMKPVDTKKNPGLAKLPTPVRNKMGFMKKGGMADEMDKKQDKSMIKKAVGMHDKQQHAGKKTSLATLKKGGSACAPKKMAMGGLASGHKAADGVATKGKTKARQVTMKKGGYC